MVADARHAVNGWGMGEIFRTPGPKPHASVAHLFAKKVVFVNRRHRRTDQKHRRKPHQINGTMRSFTRPSHFGVLRARLQNHRCSRNSGCIPVPNSNENGFSAERDGRGVGQISQPCRVKPHASLAHILAEFDGGRVKQKFSTVSGVRVVGQSNRGEGGGISTKTD